MMLTQSLVLLIAGMTSVFLFLTLLVLCTSLMSFVVRRFFPTPECVSDQPRFSEQDRCIGTHERNKRTAVITAAIAHHRHSQ